MKIAKSYCSNGIFLFTLPGSNNVSQITVSSLKEFPENNFEKLKNGFPAISLSVMNFQNARLRWRRERSQRCVTVGNIRSES